MRYRNEKLPLPPRPKPIIWNGLTFTALEDNSNIYFTKSTTGNRIVYYSYDAHEWTELGSSTSTGLTLKKGDFIYCRAAFTGTTNYTTTPQFKLSGKWKASGKICSLLYNSDYSATQTTQPTCGFSRLFYGCSALYDIDDLDFDGIINLGPTGCTRMFSGCTNITKALINGIVKGTEYALQYMFDGCSKLAYIEFRTLTSTGSLSTYFSRGVATSGTFVKAIGSNWEAGTSGIPNGWTTINV